MVRIKIHSFPYGKTNRRYLTSIDTNTLSVGDYNGQICNTLDPFNVSISTWTSFLLSAASSNILVYFEYVELDWRFFGKAVRILSEAVHDGVCAAEWACDAFQHEEFAIEAYDGHGFWETQGSPDGMHADDILANLDHTCVSASSGLREHTAKREICQSSLRRQHGQE